jgi:hypothetical protein
MPGWTAKLAGIPVDQFELFDVLVTLPDTDTATFPTTQTYADGTVVHWDQQPLPDGSEPDHPAPTLILTEARPTHGHNTLARANPPTSKAKVRLSPDNTARGLAGGALLLGALGVGVALARRRT